MDVNLMDIGQVRMMIDQIANTLQEHHGYLQEDNSLAERALKWFLDKQKEYTKDIYLDKFQNQVVYLHEGSMAYLNVARDFLCSGYPVLDVKEVKPFLFSVRQNAFQPSSEHENYIRNGCNGCTAHQNHNRYEGFYKLRRSGNYAKYQEEIEFSAIAYQMEFILAQNFTAFLLFNVNPGIALLLPPKDVRNVLEERIKVWTMIFGKLMKIGDTSLSSNTHWQVIWANELKKLSRNSISPINSSLGYGPPSDNSARKNINSYQNNPLPINSYEESDDEDPDAAGQALGAFMAAKSIQDMQKAVRDYPFIESSLFVDLIKGYFVKGDAAAELKAHCKKQLSLLEAATSTGKNNIFNRFWGK